MPGPLPLLEIRRLTVGYGQGRQQRLALRNVSLTMEAGRSYGVVGESGSGKTTLALAVMGYLPQAGRVVSGQILFDGRDLTGLSTTAMRSLWGSQMALVPQDPLSSLNPSLTIGQQLEEPLREHMGLGRAQRRGRSRELLEMVKISDAERVLDRYPHQISGGMQQRVMIAMALSTDPKLLVLDEPTTSLDATTQANFLDLVRELMQERQTAALYVSHNLGVIAQICQRVAVMYAGELVEDGPTAAIYHQPLFPYTRGLLDSVPRLGENKGEVNLRPIEGRIPELDSLPSGCVFRPRCPVAIDICSQTPPLFQASETHSTRCHRWQEIQRGDLSPRQPEPETPDRDQSPVRPRVLETTDLEVRYERPRSVLDWLRRRASEPVRALNGVSLAVNGGQTLGLVGESGSGKTTWARAVLGLVRPKAGDVRMMGETLPAGLDARELSRLRQLQAVFQNPQEALNPYLTVAESLRYPLTHLQGLAGEAADRAIAELLRAVNLPPSFAQRLPRQLSGGEKQRVAIARAFAAGPLLFLADEPVTSLDVSVQASILNLLNELQAQHNIAYVLISHDLAVVGYLSDMVAVIYFGELMEVAQAGDLFEPPYHPYTEALLSAIPLIDPKARQERIRLEGELPSPVDQIGGCPFHTRCPRLLGDVCVEERPPWRESGQGKQIYCHIPLEQLSEQQRRAFEFDRSDLQ